MENNPSRRHLSLNADDPFLTFLDYDQEKLNSDYENNKVVPRYPLAPRLTFKGGKPLGFQDQMKQVVDRYIDQTDQVPIRKD